MRYTLNIDHKLGRATHDLGVYTFINKYGVNTETYKQLYEQYFEVPYESLTIDERFVEPVGFIQDDESLIPVPSHVHAFITLPNGEVHQELYTGWVHPHDSYLREREDEIYKKCFRPLGFGFYEFGNSIFNEDGMRLFVSGIIRQFGQHELPDPDDLEKSEEYFRTHFYKPHVERKDILNNRFKAAEDYLTGCVPTYCEWGQGDSGGYRYDDVIEALKIASGI